MSVDYSRLRSTTLRQLAAALEMDGFSLHRQRGSHRRYRHPGGRQVTLSFHHTSDTFPHVTLRSIMEIQARWTEQDLRRLGLTE
ncbi:MAG TPA: addiction module toxin, HicA family [Firmicutes bacterium]|nr:addiction module toxin, HicA family [Bacillota bacterium]